VFAAAKIGVHLAWEEGIFGDVCVPRVLVQREEEKPCYADYDEQGGQVRWELKDAAVLSQREDGCCCLIIRIYFNS
jgi:hypothetical protein